MYFPDLSYERLNDAYWALDEDALGEEVITEACGLWQAAYAVWREHNIWD